MDTGQTQYTSPFVAEIKPDSSDPAEEPEAYWGEATDPANAVQRPEVIEFQPPVDQPMQVRGFSHQDSSESQNLTQPGSDEYNWRTTR